jgi:hypothetical protein
MGETNALVAGIVCGAAGVVLGFTLTMIMVLLQRITDDLDVVRARIETDEDPDLTLGRRRGRRAQVE